MLVCEHGGERDDGHARPVGERADADARVGRAPAELVERDVATEHVAVARRPPGRFHVVAHGAELPRAAIRERARARRSRGRRPRIGSHGRGDLVLAVDLRHRREQHVRVRVVGRRVHLLRGPDLAELAQVEHAHAVGQRSHDREVVRDEQVGDPLVGLQLAQQLDDARLHGDVERRQDLVAQHETGLRRERARDRDALALAARELVRKAAREGDVEPDGLERLLHAGAARLAVQPEEQLERAAHDLVHALAGVERGVGVLQHELDLPPDVLRSRLDRGGEASALERDRSAERAEHPADRPRDRRLAAARLADERERLTRPQVELDLSHDHERACAHAASGRGCGRR